MIHSNTHDRRCCHVHLPLAALAFVFLDPASALAGMPVVLLTDMARMRIQTISFFLMGLLLSSKLIQWIWNSLGRDFAILPRLSYTKALGVVTLWGLLFVLVLTMISGARELMTPGAWEKNGATYRLPKPSTEVSPSTDDSSESVRYSKLENLRQALWQYAATHQGRFPADRNFAEVPSEKWQLPDPSGLRYL